MPRRWQNRLLGLLVAASLCPAMPGAPAVAAGRAPGTLSGRVLLRDQGVPGVVVRLEGEKTAEAVTDETGAFSFAALPQGVYRLTPSSPGQTFSPPFRAATLLQGSPAPQDFRLVPFDIRGRVTLLGAGKAGCTVTLTGAKTVTTQTDASGAYVFPNLVGGTYRVTPALPGQALVPDSREVTVAGADSMGNDFAVMTYALRGRVMAGGEGLAGCPVSLEGARKGSAVTDAKGSYLFPGLPRGVYKVVPAPRYQLVAPASREVAVAEGDVTVEDFSLVTWVLSGKVTLYGQGFAGCTVSLSGDREGSTVTDSSGNYSFPGLPRGKYRITPMVAGQSLTPANRAVTLAGNTGGNDFVLTTCAVEGRVTLNGVGYPGCTVSLTGPKPMSTLTDSSGNFLFIGVLAGSYKVAPSLAGQHFTPEDRWVTVGDNGVRGVAFTLRSYDICGRAQHNGKGIPGITVMLTGSVNLLGMTDSEGLYCFRGVPNGRYSLTARLHGQQLLPADAQAEVSNGHRSGVDFFAPYFIWHVDRQARSATADGLTWRTAFTHPMDAVKASQVGDKIWVAAGTYTPAEGTSPVVVLKSGIEIYGGFSGTEADPSQRVTGKTSTLDGKGTSSHVVVAAGNTRLDGFTVTGGRALDENGAGLLAQDARDILVSNCIFSGNMARHRSTGGRGAAIYGAGSSGIVQGCGFSFNEVGQVFGEVGGAGIDLEESSFRVERCTFNGNKAPAGAGIFASRSELTVADCSFTNNFATDGSGIYIRGCSPAIVNCLFAKNIASHNAAIYADQSSTPSVRNCTVVQNMGGWWTGAILNARNSTSEVVNSILWGNSGSQIHHYLVPSPDPSQPPSRVTYSDVQFGYPGKGNINASPRFADLLRGDFRLAAGSAAIDAGDRVPAPNDSGEDLVGNARVVDGDGDRKAVIDMGAYEYEP
jgi:hypothetical protein